MCYHYLRKGKGKWGGRKVRRWVRRKVAMFHTLTIGFWESFKEFSFTSRDFTRFNWYSFAQLLGWRSLLWLSLTLRQERRKKMQERRCWSFCLVSGKFSCDLEPLMKTELEWGQKWGFPLLHLVQRQHLESYYLHWYPESLHQDHSSSPQCNFGQKLNV